MEKIETKTRHAILEVLHGHQPWPMTLIGEAGSGKSCAALCVCDYVGGSVYSSVSDLCHMIRDGIISSAGYAYYDADVWKGWRGATIAVLDELGIREKASDFQYETVKKAIDERIDNERPLILISNMSIPELARCYDDRIASRVGSGTVLVTNGDRRLSSC